MKMRTRLQGINGERYPTAFGSIIVLFASIALFASISQPVSAQVLYGTLVGSGLDSLGLTRCCALTAGIDPTQLVFECLDDSGWEIS